LAASDLLTLGVSPEKINERIRCNASLPGLRLRATAMGRAFLVRNFAAFTWLRESDFARTGSDPADTESLVNDLLTLKGISFAAFFVEDTDSVRVSLRSRGEIAAADIAHVFDGGGHPQAAGCRISLPLSEALESVRRLVEEKHAEWLALAE
jgi:phosphoesterase RecJ-like protein